MDKGGSERTVTTTEMPKFMRKHMENALKKARYYEKWQPPVSPPFSTVTAYSPETEAALNMTQQLATQGVPGVSDAYGLLGQTLTGSYLGAPGMSFGGPLSQIGTGAYLGLDPDLQQIMQGSMLGQPTSAMGRKLENIGRGAYTQNIPYGETIGALAAGGQPSGITGELERTIAGDYLHGGPGFQAALGAAERQIMPRVQSAFGRGGRSGSGLAQAAVGQQLGDVFAGQYGQERARQMQAMGMLGAQEQANLDRQLRAAGLGGQMTQAERARQMQALGMMEQRAAGREAQQLQALLGGGQLTQAERARQLQALGLQTGLYGDERSRQMQALGMAPTFQSMAYQPAQALRGVGATREAKAQEELADQIARWEREQYGGQMALDQYIARIQGMAPYAGTMGTTISPMYRNPLAGALGGGLTGLGIGSMMAPQGATGMAALGGPAGLGLAGSLGVLGLLGL